MHAVARTSLVVAAALAALALVACSSSKSSRNNGGNGGGGGAASAELSVAEIAVLEARREDPAVVAPVLEGGGAGARARAALMLARAEHTDAGAALLRGLVDDDAQTRLHAAFGLGQLDLALVEGFSSHDRLRTDVEARLAARLSAEPSGAVQVAIVRALGRVSAGEGLDALVRIASGSGALRADALYALGVAGARRDASRGNDPALLAAVHQALDDDDDGVRRGAAYAAFRQKLSLGRERFAAVAKESDATARVHLARAMQERLDIPAPAVALLGDTDWRVRVEAARALEQIASKGGRPAITELEGVARVAAARLVREPARYGAEGHVVRTACEALASREANIPPDEGQAALGRILDALEGGGDTIAPVRCACAVAFDALGTRPDRVKSCAGDSWTAEQLRRLEVLVAGGARLSGREQAAWLKTALSDTSPLVRVAAAWALGEVGTRHALQVGADALETERDPAVAGALLALFAGEGADAVSDATLARVVNRFEREAETLEEMEPLLQAATLLRRRPSMTAKGALERLLVHTEPRLRELASGVPHGERAHVPRARTDAPPDAGELPLGAVLKTERGDIRIAFERELAPLTVQNFARLARDGFFNGHRFHRVVADFVAQGGDPRGDGSGGPGYTIPCENHDGRYQRGSVGMALAGKDTGGSQFFLAHTEQPHLDGRYTLFARVVEGLEVMDALQPDDRILSVDFAGAVPAR
jgi:cyclophilin family peptidyl-prolyl cis-trans isomerase/HEAT repeat protein